MSSSRFSDWLARNLAVQGYSLDAVECRRLWLGLRFSTGLCLPLVVVAIALESPPLLVALAGVGAFAGFTPRHPFDLIWNYAVRRLLDAPALPPNPARRRHAFKIGTGWLLTVAALFAAAQPLPALVAGGLLAAACASATALNFCVPSFLLSLLERRRSAVIV